MLGWIDFSTEERRRVDDVLERMRFRDTIDELGLGLMRDRIAETLFPGTSTLHTHARYYFLTAYLLKDLEANDAGEPVDRIREDLTEGEREIAEALLKAHPGDVGIIGSTRLGAAGDGPWVRQTPTAIYWTALRSYGLLEDSGGRRLTLRSFISQLSAADRRSGRGDSAEDDDPAARPSPTSARLRAHELDVYPHWRDDVTLTLRPEERQWMEEVIRRRSYATSLYAALLGSDTLRGIANDAMAPPSGSRAGDRWTFIRFADLTKGESERSALALETGFDDWDLVDLAADFSALAAVLQSRYNWLVQALGTEEAPDEEHEEYYLWKRSGPFLDRALGCDLEALFHAPELGDPLARDPRGSLHRMRRFLARVQERLSASDYDEVDDLIEGRERALKGRAHSRTVNAAANARNEQGARRYFGSPFNFRLDVATTMANEIATSRE